MALCGKRFCALLVACIGMLSLALAEQEATTMQVSLDQAVYSPGAQAVCTVTACPAQARTLRATLMHLERRVAVYEAPAAEGRVTVPMPEADFTGYLMRVEAIDEAGRAAATADIGIDCATSWTRFPRYGYIWDYTDGADPQAKIDDLTRYHLNGLQFYDWQYRHHQPVAPDPASWTDWSGREISGRVLRGYLDAAHGAGMTCMAYNMVYAANMTYLTDGSGVDPAWRLVKAGGEDFTCDMDASLGPVGVLQYFNLLNPDWQAYLFRKEREVFDAFAFDGWHGDTIGENGRMTASDGGPLGYDGQGRPIWRVKDCYTAFLNAAKAAIAPRYMMFNPVGAQGVEQVNQSDVDVLYTEFWPWDPDDRGVNYADYGSLHRAILRAQEQSGGKSLIVAAYVNYKHPSPTFNDPAVLLLDAAVFASGGARIELGNGDGMLSNEYFPDDRRKRMSPALREAVTRMYDFITAYENLLRDGQRPVARTVRIGGLAVSELARADTVWCFAKADDTHEVYHFINLMGTDSAWRDEDQAKPAPAPQEALRVRLYTEKAAEAVYIASPDTADLAAHALPFTTGRDADGAYIDFTMPCLRCWNMVFLR